MSTSPVLVPVSLVSQFLANEKMASRYWFQCQMECLLDQVFDQLSTKFEDYLASNAITGTAHHTTIEGDHIQHQHQQEPSFQAYSHTQFQSNTDPMINTEIPVAAGQTQNQGQMMNVNGQVNHNRDYLGDYNLMNTTNEQVNPEEIVSGALILDQTTYGKPQYQTGLSVTTTNRELSNQNDANEGYGLDVGDDQLQDEDIDNDTARVDSDKPKIKEEFDDTNNQLIITTDHMGLSLFATHSNKQSNHNLTNEDDESEDDCDCDDCRNGIEVKEEEVEDGDVQFIEDIEDRMETTQPNHEQSPVTKQSSRLVRRNQTDQVQHINQQSNFDRSQSNEQTEPTVEDVETNDVNSQDKQFTTLLIQCLHTGCSRMFITKTVLNHHMSTQHGILPHRCLVKDCKQSFNNKYNLSEHIKQVHANTTQWNCDHCPKNFHTYRILSLHNHQYHQLGQYKCAFANCSFMGAHRRKVYDHYRDQHKSTVEFTCHHPNCGRRFKVKSNFTKHQRGHLDIKPYRCKWFDCIFASTTQSNVLRHIKLIHLTQDQSSNEDDPRKYLEVRRDLL